MRRKRTGKGNEATHQSTLLLIYVRNFVLIYNIKSQQNELKSVFFFVLYNMGIFSSGIPEANGHSPAHSSTSLSGRSGSGSVGTSAAAGGPAAAPGGGVVVDLTLDSSEEEEGGGGGGDSDDTEDSNDSPAPKRGRYNYDKDLVTAY